MEALGAAARRAVAAAEAEALAIGHDRIGTEHLLLGILADESAAAWQLADAGARLPRVRRKVLEALPARPAGSPPGAGPLELTARAARALARAVRSSHGRRADMVTPEHLLVGVLDVEGTAGQVLRSLGVDLDRLRAAVLSGEDLRPPAPAADADAVAARADAEAEGEVGAAGEDAAAAPALLCPSCGAAVADDLSYRVVRATGHGTRDAGVYSCGACGAVLGVVAP